MADPVLLIHGMFANHQALERMAGLLRAQGFDVHCPDLPGHAPGRDDPGLGTYSLGDYVDALSAYVVARDWPQPPILIGHSLGGLLAMQLASRVAALALVLLVPAPPSNLHALSLSALPAFVGMLGQRSFWRRPYKPSFEALRQVAFAGIDEARQRRLYDQLGPESGRVILQVGASFLDRGRASRVDFGSIGCPVYVVACGLDRLVSAAVVRRIANRIPGATLRMWPDRGHLVIDDEHTEQTVQELVGWLRPILARFRRQQPAIRL